MDDPSEKAGARELDRAPDLFEATSSLQGVLNLFTREAEVARQLSKDPDQVWRVHAREELGIDPDDLPSPWVAAVSSFAALGALALRNDAA